MRWAFKAVHLLQESSSLAGDYQAKLLLGKNNYLRVNSEQAEAIKLDAAKQCVPLKSGVTRSVGLVFRKLETSSRSNESPRQRTIESGLNRVCRNYSVAIDPPRKL